MINIMILCKKDELVEIIKKEIHLCIKCDIFIHQEWEIERIKKDRTKYLFMIVDIDEFGSIPNIFKSQEKWLNSYYIYLSKNTEACLKAIGYNVLGYFTYNQLKDFNQAFKSYLSIITKTFHCYFKTEDGIESFRYNEILYFEIKNRHIIMQTIYGQQHLINYKLIDILAILDQRFIRINKSVVLNMDYTNRLINSHMISIRYQQINKEFNISRKYYFHLNKKIGSLNKITHI